MTRMGCHFAWLRSETSGVIRICCCAMAASHFVSQNSVRKSDPLCAGCRRRDNRRQKSLICFLLTAADPAGQAGSCCPFVVGDERVTRSITSSTPLNTRARATSRTQVRAGNCRFVATFPVPERGREASKKMNAEKLGQRHRSQKTIASEQRDRRGGPRPPPANHQVLSLSLSPQRQGWREGGVTWQG